MIYTKFGTKMCLFHIIIKWKYIEVFYHTQKKMIPLRKQVCISYHFNTLLLIKVEHFYFVFIYCTEQLNLKNIQYHIDIILRPKLYQFVQFEISPSMSHTVFIFLKITPLCCLFFFDLRILITPLVSSNSSYL